jgi:hypothetical protein
MFQNLNWIEKHSHTVLFKAVCHLIQKVQSEHMQAYLQRNNGKWSYHASECLKEGGSGKRRIETYIAPTITKASCWLIDFSSHSRIHFTILDHGERSTTTSLNKHSNILLWISLFRIRLTISRLHSMVNGKASSDEPWEFILATSWNIWLYLSNNLCSRRYTLIYKVS